MEKLLDIISRYHFLNYLIPGVIFLYLLNILGIYSINLNDIVTLLFGGYFVGMILSRVGSVVIEPWFRKWKIVKYIPYWNYLKAESKDAKISILLTDNNMFRTMVAMLLLTIITYAFHLIPFVDAFLHTRWAVLVVLVLVLFLFILAYNKGTSFIFDRVEKVNEEQQ